MIFVYRIVFLEEFEYIGYIIIFIYIYFMIMYLWLMVRELNVVGLILVNYYFVFLYVLELVLKVCFKIEMYFI